MGKQQVAAAKAKVEEILSAPEPALELKEGEIAITIEVEEENVRSVIGRGGSTIKDIQEKTGSKLSIPRGGTTLTIHGPEEGVNKAKEMVEEVLKKSRELNAKRAERESAAAAYAAEMATSADADTSLEEGEIRPSEIKNMKLTADEDDALDWGSTPTLGDAFGVSGSQEQMASTTGQWADSSINTSGW